MSVSEPIAAEGLRYSGAQRPGLAQASLKPKACKAGAAQLRLSASEVGRATPRMGEGSAKGAGFTFRRTKYFELSTYPQALILNLIILIILILLIEARNVELVRVCKIYYVQI